MAPVLLLVGCWEAGWGRVGPGRYLIVHHGSDRGSMRPVKDNLHRGPRDWSSTLLRQRLLGRVLLTIVPPPVPATGRDLGQSGCPRCFCLFCRYGGWVDPSPKETGVERESKDSGRQDNLFVIPLRLVTLKDVTTFIRDKHDRLYHLWSVYTDNS